jgi:phosphate transport system substrate-binding protein
MRTLVELSRPRRALLLVGLAVTVLLAMAKPVWAVEHAQIEGKGSTWSQVIVNQWIADVDAQGMKVVYTGVGSSAGRKEFAADHVDFGITEIPFQGTDEQGNSDSAGSRKFAYLPIVAGGTAFSYQIKVGNNLVKNLRLSGGTIAKIFTNKITNWNDAAITKDNNGHALPSLPIVPVLRSDGSGTTAQFTRWMDAQYPDDWRPFFGKSGLTSYYPRKGNAVAASGSDQVMNTISGAAGNGTIGYVEYSYAVNKHYPVVKVLNGAGYYVEPTQYNVAVALTKAKINQDEGSPNYLTQILDDVYKSTDPQAYPLSSYSYMLLPTGGSDDPRLTTAKRQTLADFMFYSLCTGQSKAGAYGYSPLPLNLVQAGFDQIAKLKTADSAVDLTSRSVTDCNNPTFVKGDLTKNHLAEIAPAPPACDKDGAGPCGGATGSAPTSVKQAETAATSSGSTAAGGGAAATGTDPITGEAVGASSGGDATLASGGSAAVPIDLLSSRAGDTKVFGALAVLELLAITFIPGAVAVYLRRREREETS